MILCN